MLAALIVLVQVVAALGLAGIVEQWLRAEREKTEARHLFYVANMNLAQQAWEKARRASDFAAAYIL